MNAKRKVLRHRSVSSTNRARSGTAMLIFAAAGFSAATVHGQNVYQWTGDNSGSGTFSSPFSGNFSDPLSWFNTTNSSTGVPVSAASTVLDFSGSGSSTYTATYDSALNSGGGVITGPFTLNEIQLSSTASVAETIAPSVATNTLSFTSNGSATPQLLQNGTGGFNINAGLALANNLLVGGSGSGALNLNGNITGAANLTLAFTGGVVNLSGNNTYTGTTTINGGTVNYVGSGSFVGGSSSSLDVGNATGTTTVLNLNSTGAYNFSNGVSVADNAANSAAINLNSGTLNLENPSGSYVSLGNSGYGSLVVSGSAAMNVGTSSNSTGLRVGTNGSTALGIYTQTGGTVVLQRYLAIANGGVGIATLTGGTLTVFQTRSLVGDNATATSVLNLGTEAGGNNVFSTTLGLEVQDQSGITNANNSTTNLDSGTLILGGTGIYTASVATLNLNGATIADASTNTNLINSSLGLAAHVYNGGAVFNIGSGATDTVTANLLTTTGNGIYVPGGTFPVASGSGGAGYIGAPQVTVIGGGTGATAVADVSNGVITGVTMTSPGQGYTAGPITFNFSGGGATTPVTSYTTTLATSSLAPNGTGGVTMSGAGTLILAGANGYTGPTNISSGTLQVNTGGNLGVTSSVSIASGSLLVMNTTGAVNIPGPISGQGGFSQIAAGTTTFNGANTYTGATTLSSGSLVLAPGASLGNTAIAAASGTTLYAQSSTGSITVGSGSASLALAAGAKLNMLDGAIETLNLVNTLGNTALTLGTSNSSTPVTLSFDLSQSSSDSLVVTGNASVLSPVTININALASDTSLTPGNYTIISAGAGLGTSLFSLGTTTLDVNSTGYALNLNSSTGTAEILSVLQTGGVIANAYWAGAIDNVWSTDHSNSTNWRTDATSNIDTGVTPSSVTNVFFTVASGGANLNTTLSSNQAVNSLNFTGAASGPVSISGNTLTINALAAGGNAAGNGINVSSGASTNTVNSNVILANSQTWTNNSTNPLIVNGSVGGSATLTQAGSGQVVLAGSNTFNGGYTLTSGSLAINSPTALGTGLFTISGPVAIDNTSSAAITMTANNTQAWNADFTFTGSSDLNMGTGAVTLGSNRIVTLTAGNLTVGGIGDGGFGYSLTVAGNGNLNTTGSSTYSGATVVTGGSLSFIGASSSANTTSLDIAQAGGQTAVVNFNTSGTVSFNGNVTIADASDAIGAINVINGTVDVPAAGSINYLTVGNGGYGALTISGGSLTVGSVATSSGMRIGGGTPSGVGVLLQTGGALTSYRYLAIANEGYGQATFTGGSTTLIGYRTIVGDGTGSAVMNLGTLAGGTSLFTTGGNGGLIVNGSGSANATLNLDAGTLNLSSGSVYASSGTGSSNVNLNGAVIQAGAAGLTLIANTLNSANVYNGGANFNVPTGLSSSVTANLSATTGNGIYAGGTGGTFAVTGNGSVGYVGAPVCYDVSGGSGSGAMAIADMTNGVITGVTITNPGQGYQVGDNLTFEFSDGGYNTTATNFNYTLTAADIAPNNGGVTKTGGGSLTLSGSSTYTGNTLVKSGTLVVGNPLALGTGSAVLSNGTTLALGTITAGASFSNYTINTNGVFTPVLANNGTSLTLTSPNLSEATSAFNPTPVTVSDSTGFVASFTYTHAATGGLNAAADGVVFVIQSQGANALGQAGGAQGYTGTDNVTTGGIPNSVAAGINLYMDELEAGEGGTFTNTTGADTVPFISAYGSSNVTITYNGPAQTLTETITSNSNGGTYTLVTTGVDVASLLGGPADGSASGYIGFTGGTGAVDDSQTISNFTFGTTTTPLSTTAVGMSNGVIVNPASVAIIQLSPTASFSVGQVGPITIGSGGTLAVSIGSSPAAGVTHGVLTTPSVTFSNSSSGTLDVGRNALDITGQSLASVTAMVASAYNNGAWTGPGITSSAAAADTTHLTALGVIQNNQGGTPIYTSSNTFEGITPGASDVLVKFTYYGDANLSGTVDASDYSLVDNGFLNQLTGWYNGDFNYDGVVNGSDYTLIDNAFNMQGASLAGEFAQSTAQIAGSVSGATSAVPEPASLALAAVAALGLLGRRRRWSN